MKYKNNLTTCKNLKMKKQIKIFQSWNGDIEELESVVNSFVSQLVKDPIKIIPMQSESYNPDTCETYLHISVTIIYTV